MLMPLLRKNELLETNFITSKKEKESWKQNKGRGPRRIADQDLRDFSAQYQTQYQPPFVRVLEVLDGATPELKFEPQPNKQPRRIASGRDGNQLGQRRWSGPALGHVEEAQAGGDVRVDEGRLKQRQALQPKQTFNQSAHSLKTDGRMRALPDIVCRAANGDFYLLSMEHLGQTTEAWSRPTHPGVKPAKQRSQKEKHLQEETETIERDDESNGRSLKSRAVSIITPKTNKSNKEQKWVSIFGMDHNFGLDEYGRPVFVPDDEKTAADKRKLHKRQSLRQGLRATHSGLPADLDSAISSSNLGRVRSINPSNDSSQRASWDTSSGARPLPPGGWEEGAERAAEVFAKRAARASTQHSIAQSLHKRREAKRLEQDRPASKLRDRYVSVVFSDAVPVVPEEETLEELKERQIENRELFSKLLTGQGVLDASSLMKLDLDLEQEGTNASRIKRWEKASNVVRAKLANDLIPLDDSYNSHLFKEESFEMSWQEEYLSTCMQLNMAPSSTCLKEMAKPTALLNHLLLKMNGSKAISAALPYNQTITTLLLEDNNLGPGSLKYLVRGLAMNRMVTTLDLSYNPMGSQGSTIVAELVEMKNKHRNSCAQLETLVLNACFIDDTGAGALAFSLLGNHKLRVLHLKNNKIGDQGVEQLADMLADQEKLCYLKELNLAWNNFGHAGAMAIAEALKVNIRLTHLYMPWNGLESEGNMFICAALSENATLNLLDLSHTRAGPETCLVLSAALRLNDTLEQLHLNGNPLGADGGRHLMWGLHISKSITTLGVQGCVFAKEGPVADMVGFADVNLQHPDDHYELNLAKPVQRSVALELFHANRQLGDSSIKRIKLQKQWYTETCAKLAEDMPHTGVLEFDFSTQAAVSGEGRGILLAGPKEIGAVQRQFSDVKTSNTSRASFLEVMASHFFFTCHSAACILRTFEYGDEQVDAAVKLFMRSCDSENFRHMVAGLVSPQVNEKIMDAIGFNIQFRFKNPTGYYLLDLSKDAEHTLAHTLQELSLTEMNPKTIRNMAWAPSSFMVWTKPKPFTFKGNIPSNGWLSFDFLTANLDRTHGPFGHRYGFLKSRPMRPREFDAFLVGLYGVKSSRGDYSRDKCVDHMAARKNSHFIREFSVVVCVTCQQVVKLSQGIPESAARVELVVSLFSRILDQENFHTIMYAMEIVEQALLIRRLGASICAPMERSSLHYALDCELAEERSLCKSLIDYAVNNVVNHATQNIHNLRINGRPLKITENKNMWAVIMMESLTPKVEFDFLGPDWKDCVLPCGIDVKDPTEQEWETFVKNWANRKKLARARMMHLVQKLRYGEEYGERKVEKAGGGGALSENSDLSVAGELPATGRMSQASSSATLRNSTSNEELNASRKGPGSPPRIPEAHRSEGQSRDEQEPDTSGRSQSEQAQGEEGSAIPKMPSMPMSSFKKVEDLNVNTSKNSNGGHVQFTEDTKGENNVLPSPRAVAPQVLHKPFETAESPRRTRRLSAIHQPTPVARREDSEDMDPFNQLRAENSNISTISQHTDADDDGGAAALEKFQKIIKKVETALTITHFFIENRKEAWDKNFGELPWETYWERFVRVFDVIIENENEEIKKKKMTPWEEFIEETKDRITKVSSENPNQTVKVLSVEVVYAFFKSEFGVQQAQEMLTMFSICPKAAKAAAKDLASVSQDISKDINLKAALVANIAPKSIGKAGPGPGPVNPGSLPRKDSVSLLKEEDSGDIGEDGKVIKRKIKYEYAGLDPQRILRQTEFAHLMMHCAPLGSSGRNLFTASVLVVPPTMPFPHHSESIGLSKRPKNLELRKKIGKMFKVTNSKDEDSD